MVQLVKSRKKKKPALRLVATCGAGLEEIVADEIRVHGGKNISSTPGAVSWEGNLESGYRMCLWSRFASRILTEIASFTAADPDILYRQTSKLDWEEHFDVDTTFAVFSTISDSPISHSKYAALRIKDAIVDQFRARVKKRPNVDLARPGIRINLHLRGENASLAVDLSGESLHRRGYRVKGVEAPLKETLAAGIVRLAGFTSDFPADAVLLDPMCGSGTLLIEAAMMFGDVAPGLLRKTFGFQAWKHHNQKLWEKLVDEALQREEEGLQKPWPRIIGMDADPQAVQAARQNIETAGFEDKIQVNQRQFSFLERPAEKGMMLINPPYGERLSDRDQVKYLYRCIGRKVSKELADWQIGFFAANPDLADSLQIQWESSINLYNGPIRCRLYNGTGQYKPPKAFSPPAPIVLEPEMEGFGLARCLVENHKTLTPWIEKENISCFRIYDRELPEYNFCIELYGEWAYVTEYPVPKGQDRNKARANLQKGLNVLRQTFQIPPSRVFINTPQVKEKKPQDKKKQKKKKLVEVRENQCLFLVDFTAPIETGLPMDMRSIRQYIGKLVQGKKFLNLYGSTGTATVYALQHNALATTTVDSFTNNLQRTKSNISLNGFGGSQHNTLQQDALKWIQHNKERYGLILVAPPPVIKDREGEQTFSVHKDHETLLNYAMQSLSREGLLIFTTDARNFTLADSLSSDFDVRDITQEMIPEDCRQSQSKRSCWEFRHSGVTTEHG